MSNIEQQETIENVMVIPQLTVSEQGTPMASSLDVAKVFGKEHFNVLQSIEKLLEDVPEDFNALNFQGVEYTDAKGENRPMYLLTRDAFTLLAMGFTGKKAMKFKIAYIEAFNAMEKALITKEKQKIKKPIPQIEKERESFFLPPMFTHKLSEKGLSAIKGLMHYIAFLNNTSYEDIENYCLKTLGVSSLQECNGYMGNSLVGILSFYQSNMYFFSSKKEDMSLELYKNAFYGLIDYWKLFRRELTQENIELHICKIANLQSVEQIKTKEQYLKGIFIVFKSLTEERYKYNEE